MMSGKYYATTRPLIRLILALMDRFIPSIRNPFVLDEFTSCKILIVRVEHLGDVISTSSLQKALNQYSPNSKIDIVIANHSKILKGILVGYEKVFIIPSLLFHDRSGASIFYKLINSFKSYYLLKKIISKEKYDCVIFSSHHLYGMQILGLFAKKSIAFSSIGFKFLHSNIAKIGNYSSVIDRTYSLVSCICKGNFNEKDFNYTTIPAQKESEFIVNSPYIVLTISSGDQAKNLTIDDIEDVISDYNINFANIYLVGDLPADISLSDLEERLFYPIVFLGTTLSMHKLINLITFSSAVITSDSFLAHLSASCEGNVKIYIIYKNNIGIRQWYPPGENIHKILALRNNNC
tara:strand:- start:14785 stop:15831 length:1047 start_codon:yes stop_codon:yes gene_type:complete